MIRLRARRLQVRALKRTADLPDPDRGYPGFRTGGMLGILPVGCLLFVGNQHTEVPFGVRGSDPHTRLHDRARVVRKGRT